MLRVVVVEEVDERGKRLLSQRDIALIILFTS